MLLISRWSNDKNQGYRMNMVYVLFLLVLQKRERLEVLCDFFSSNNEIGKQLSSIKYFGTKSYPNIWSCWDLTIDNGGGFSLAPTRLVDERGKRALPTLNYL